MNKKKINIDIRKFLSWTLLYTSAFMIFSTFMHIIEGNDEWFSRLFLAIVSAGLSALVSNETIQASKHFE